ncbi:putative protein kinase [Leptomonas seymouri]|uniref:Protein kinase domain-containing protein n=1 Tax=Leptomonas seymouri TaxID=5684 RepID=A0A0N1HT76_LEPSE|nr:putative protein kinase [Leptomonas seymouri]|eukprot:KPI82961.1 putative protein kinase [Leptomonas seymouri]
MSTYRCSLCHSSHADRELSFCICCRNAVCDTCTQLRYPNRSSVGVCARCTPPQFAFRCGRCAQSIPHNEIEFFCDMCATTICFSCVCRGSSFECGLLKCFDCCDYPMSQAPRSTLIRHDVDGLFLRSVPLPIVSSASPVTAPPARACIAAVAAAAARNTKYRKLLGREKLGEGAQGVVYRCHTEENEDVVVKEMIFNDTDIATFDSQARQVERMRQLNHPHLIRYLDVFVIDQPPRICVVMPYYNEGDLKKFIERQRKPVTEVKLCSIVLQIAGALNYLHTQDPPLVHRDIKPENILLLSNEEQVLLMDLDLCGTVDATTSVIKRRELSPTYEYRAPELEKSYGSTKADVFSLGVVMFVLAVLPEFPCVRTESGDSLVLSAAEWTPKSLERAIQREIRRVRNYAYSTDFINLVVSMLEHQPVDRPTAEAVIRRLQVIMEHRLMEGKE